MFDVELQPAEIDFEWACHPTLRYFKLAHPVGLTIEFIKVIAKRLSVMPELTKVKFDSLWPTGSQVFQGSHSLKAAA